MIAVRCSSLRGGTIDCSAGAASERRESDQQAGRACGASGGADMAAGGGLAG